MLIRSLKTRLNSIENGMNKQTQELLENLSNEGTENKYALQRVEDTLHNINTLRAEEKLERDDLNIEITDRFNRIMETLDQLIASPISSGKVPDISLLGNTSNQRYQDRDYHKIKKELLKYDWKDHGRAIVLVNKK